MQIARATEANRAECNSSMSANVRQDVTTSATFPICGFDPAWHKRCNLLVHCLKNANEFGADHGLSDLASGIATPRAGGARADVRLYHWLRKGVRRNNMLLLTTIVTLLLFIYLMAALLRPEWF